MAEVPERWEPAGIVDAATVLRLYFQASFPAASPPRVAVGRPHVHDQGQHFCAYSGKRSLETMTPVERSAPAKMAIRFGLPLWATRRRPDEIRNTTTADYAGWQSRRTWGPL